jgi:hypothetical protein
MESCIADVKSWASEKKLVLNDGKTEFIHITSRFAKSDSSSLSLTVGDSVITPSGSARNLGVTMDSNLCMKNHIDTVCRSALAAIRRIGQIRDYLDKDNTARLVHAFVTSRLDSCNSLIYDLPESYLAKLQRIQNTAARLVARTPRSDHITPVLHSLHWLPVKQRTIYKILLLAFKAQHQLAPQYISELISHYTPVRSLRSSSKGLLTISVRPSTKFYGNRSFAFAAPSLWNNLPLNIRSADSLVIFKRLLKTHLFRTYFHSS